YRLQVSWLQVSWLQVSQLQVSQLQVSWLQVSWLQVIKPWPFGHATRTTYPTGTPKANNQTTFNL
ncbi:MAG: hypothetical protein F6K56_39695, partial [Moorea sp. SIO3G5]|nr:hypothetical protein [Moorena sp. SIO3G5]